MIAVIINPIPAARGAEAARARAELRGRVARRAAARPAEVFVTERARPRARAGRGGASRAARAS